jgi:hypothetical protein
VLRVAVVGNEMPYFKKNADGTDSGIIPDYYQRLAGMDGIEIQLFRVCLLR